MNDLVQWLGEQLDEDERIARAAAKKVSSPPNDGIRWRRDWDTIHTAPSDPPGKRVKVADCGYGGGDLTAHIVMHDPARVLREIDAKRRLLKEYEQVGSVPDTPENRARLSWKGDFGYLQGLARAVHLMASVYADRPGYREEWRP